jgi:hypothetical protein
MTNRYMVFVFISHSKYDIGIKNFFGAAVGRMDGLNHKMMEMENLEARADRYAAIEISNFIRYECVCLIVLLGPMLLSSPRSPIHTQNWVPFEVGVAADCRMPIWVFEEYHKEIRFPIPLVTDYCRYNLWEDESQRYIGEILVQKLAGLNSRYPIQCNFCFARYYYWNNDAIELCPVCRKRFYPRRDGFDFKPAIA